MIALSIILLVILIVVLSNGQGVPVLLYHQVNDLSNTNSALLEKHFELIKKKKLITLTASEVKQYADEKKRLPKYSVLITFDDGYYDNYLYVFPLLKKYNFKATFFINSAFIKELADRNATIIKYSDVANKEIVKSYYKGKDATSEQYLTWEEIREMQQSGLCDFQLHSHSHKLAISTLELRGFVENDDFGYETLHLYSGKPEIGYPMLRSRGETTIRKLVPKEEFLRDVQQQYFAKRSLEPSQRKKEIQEFINNYSNPVVTENDVDTEKRIREEILRNKEALTKQLKKTAVAYAWPYGHKSGFGRAIIKKENVSLFFTCKKGTNSRRPDLEKIKRIELRKPTISKLKLMLDVNSNLILGTIYGWVS